MNSQVFTVCIIVSGLVTAAVVLFYAKKNPNPYFRPKKGELVMMTLFLGIISGTGSFVLSTFFEADVNIQKFKEQAEMERQSGIRASSGENPSTRPTGSEEDPEEETPGSVVNPANPPIPPFLKER